MAELTQHLNKMENDLNGLSERNEVLRARLGLPEDSNIDISGVRVKRVEELDSLRRHSRMMGEEVGVVIDVVMGMADTATGVALLLDKNLICVGLWEPC